MWNNTKAFLAHALCSALTSAAYVRKLMVGKTFQHLGISIINIYMLITLV